MKLIIFSGLLLVTSYVNQAQASPEPKHQKQPLIPDITKKIETEERTPFLRHLSEIGRGPVYRKYSAGAPQRTTVSTGQSNAQESTNGNAATQFSNFDLGKPETFNFIQSVNPETVPIQPEVLEISQSDPVFQNSGPQSNPVTGPDTAAIATSDTENSEGEIQFVDSANGYSTSFAQTNEQAKSFAQTNEQAKSFSETNEQAKSFSETNEQAKSFSETNEQAKSFSETNAQSSSFAQTQAETLSENESKPDNESDNVERDAGSSDYVAQNDDDNGDDDHEHRGLAGLFSTGKQSFPGKPSRPVRPAYENYKPTASKLPPRTMPAYFSVPGRPTPPQPPSGPVPPADPEQEVLYSRLFRVFNTNDRVQVNNIMVALTGITDMRKAIEYCKQVTGIQTDEILFTLLTQVSGSRDIDFVLQFLQMLQGDSKIDHLYVLVKYITNESDILKGFEVIKQLTGHADFDGVYEILELLSTEKGIFNITDFFKHIAHTGGVEGVYFYIMQLTGGLGSSEFPETFKALSPEVDLKGTLDLVTAVTRSSTIGEAIEKLNTIVGSPTFARSVSVMKKITGEKQMKYALEDMTHECNKLSLSEVFDNIYRIVGVDNIEEAQEIVKRVFNLNNFMLVFQRINKMTRSNEPLLFMDSLLEITGKLYLEDAANSFKQLTRRKLSLIQFFELIRKRSGHLNVTDFFLRYLEYFGAKTIEEAFEKTVEIFNINDIFEVFDVIYRFTKVEAIIFIETIMRVTNSTNFSHAAEKINRMANKNNFTDSCVAIYAIARMDLVKFFEKLITISRRFDMEDMMIILEGYTYTEDFMDALGELRRFTGENDMPKAIDHVKQGKPRAVTATTTAASTTTDTPATTEAATTTEAPTTTEAQTTTEAPTTTEDKTTETPTTSQAESTAQASASSSDGPTDAQVESQVSDQIQILDQPAEDAFGEKVAAESETTTESVVQGASTTERNVKDDSYTQEPATSDVDTQKTYSYESLPTSEEASPESVVQPKAQPSSYAQSYYSPNNDAANETSTEVMTEAPESSNQQPAVNYIADDQTYQQAFDTPLLTTTESPLSTSDINNAVAAKYAEAVTTETNNQPEKISTAQSSNQVSEVIDKTTPVTIPGTILTYPTTGNGSNDSIQSQTNTELPFATNGSYNSVVTSGTPDESDIPVVEEETTTQTPVSYDNQNVTQASAIAYASQSQQPPADEQFEPTTSQPTNPQTSTVAPAQTMTQNQTSDDTIVKSEIKPDSEAIIIDNIGQYPAPNTDSQIQYQPQEVTDESKMVPQSSNTVNPTGNVYPITLPQQPGKNLTNQVPQASPSQTPEIIAVIQPDGSPLTSRQTHSYLVQDHPTFDAIEGPRSELLETSMLPQPTEIQRPELITVIQPTNESPITISPADYRPLQQRPTVETIVISEAPGYKPKIETGQSPEDIPNETTRTEPQPIFDNLNRLQIVPQSPKSIDYPENSKPYDFNTKPAPNNVSVDQRANEFPGITRGPNPTNIQRPERFSNIQPLNKTTVTSIETESNPTEDKPNVENNVYSKTEEDNLQNPDGGQPELKPEPDRFITYTNQQSTVIAPTENEPQIETLAPESVVQNYSEAQYSSQVTPTPVLVDTIEVLEPITQGPTTETSSTTDGTLDKTPYDSQKQPSKEVSDTTEDLSISEEPQEYVESSPPIPISSEKADDNILTTEKTIDEETKITTEEPLTATDTLSDNSTEQPDTTPQIIATYAQDESQTSTQSEENPETDKLVTTEVPITQEQSTNALPIIAPTQYDEHQTDEIPQPQVVSTAESQSFTGPTETVQTSTTEVSSSDPSPNDSTKQTPTDNASPVTLPLNDDDGDSAVPVQITPQEYTIAAEKHDSDETLVYSASLTPSSSEEIDKSAEGINIGISEPITTTTETNPTVAIDTIPTLESNTTQSIPSTPEITTGQPSTVGQSETKLSSDFDSLPATTQLPENVVATTVESPDSVTQAQKPVYFENVTPVTLITVSNAAQNSPQAQNPRLVQNNDVPTTESQPKKYTYQITPVSDQNTEAPGISTQDFYVQESIQTSPETAVTKVDSTPTSAVSQVTETPSTQTPSSPLPVTNVTEPSTVVIASTTVPPVATEEDIEPDSEIIESDEKSLSGEESDETTSAQTTSEPLKTLEPITNDQYTTVASTLVEAVSKNPISTIQPAESASGTESDKLDTTTEQIMYTPQSQQESQLRSESQYLNSPQILQTDQPSQLPEVTQAINDISEAPQTSPGKQNISYFAPYNYDSEIPTVQQPSSQSSETTDVPDTSSPKTQTVEAPETTTENQTFRESEAQVIPENQNKSSAQVTSNASDFDNYQPAVMGTSTEELAESDELKEKYGSPGPTPASPSTKIAETTIQKQPYRDEIVVTSEKPLISQAQVTITTPETNATTTAESPEEPEFIEPSEEIESYESIPLEDDFISNDYPIELETNNSPTPQKPSQVSYGTHSITSDNNGPSAPLGPQNIQPNQDYESTTQVQTESAPENIKKPTPITEENTVTDSKAEPDKVTNITSQNTSQSSTATTQQPFRETETQVNPENQDINDDEVTTTTESPKTKSAIAQSDTSPQPTEGMMGEDVTTLSPNTNDPDSITTVQAHPAEVESTETLESNESGDLSKSYEDEAYTAETSTTNPDITMVSTTEATTEQPLAILMQSPSTSQVTINEQTSETPHTTDESNTNTKNSLVAPTQTITQSETNTKPEYQPQYITSITRTDDNNQNKSQITYNVIYPMNSDLPIQVTEIDQLPITIEDSSIVNNDSTLIHEENPIENNSLELTDGKDYEDEEPVNQQPLTIISQTYTTAGQSTQSPITNESPTDTQTVAYTSTQPQPLLDDQTIIQNASTTEPTSEPITTEATTTQTQQVDFQSETSTVTPHNTSSVEDIEAPGDNESPEIYENDYYDENPETYELSPVVSQSYAGPVNETNESPTVAQTVVYTNTQPQPPVSQPDDQAIIQTEPKTETPSEPTTPEATTTALATEIGTQAEISPIIPNYTSADKETDTPIDNESPELYDHDYSDEKPETNEQSPIVSQTYYGQAPSELSSLPEVTTDKNSTPQPKNGTQLIQPVDSQSTTELPETTTQAEATIQETTSPEATATNQPQISTVTNKPTGNDTDSVTENTIAPEAINIAESISEPEPSAVELDSNELIVDDDSHETSTTSATPAIATFDNAPETSNQETTLTAPIPVTKESPVDSKTYATVGQNISQNPDSSTEPTNVQQTGSHTESSPQVNQQTETSTKSQVESSTAKTPDTIANVNTENQNSLVLTTESQISGDTPQPQVPTETAKTSEAKTPEMDIQSQPSTATEVPLTTEPQAVAVSTEKDKEPIKLPTVVPESTELPTIEATPETTYQQGNTTETLEASIYDPTKITPQTSDGDQIPTEVFPTTTTETVAPSENIIVEATTAPPETTELQSTTTSTVEQPIVNSESQTVTSTGTSVVYTQVTGDNGSSNQASEVQAQPHDVIEYQDSTATDNSLPNEITTVPSIQGATEKNNENAEITPTSSTEIPLLSQSQVAPDQISQESGTAQAQGTTIPSEVGTKPETDEPVATTTKSSSTDIAPQPENTVNYAESETTSTIQDNKTDEPLIVSSTVTNESTPELLNTPDTVSQSNTSSLAPIPATTEDSATTANVPEVTTNGPSPAPSDQSNEPSGKIAEPEAIETTATPLLEETTQAPGTIAYTEVQDNAPDYNGSPVTGDAKPNEVQVTGTTTAQPDGVTVEEQSKPQDVPTTDTVPDNVNQVSTIATAVNAPETPGTTSQAHFNAATQLGTTTTQPETMKTQPETMKTQPENNSIGTATSAPDDEPVINSTEPNQTPIVAKEDPNVITQDAMSIAASEITIPEPENITTKQLDDTQEIPTATSAPNNVDQSPIISYTSPNETPSTTNLAPIGSSTTPIGPEKSPAGALEYEEDDEYEDETEEESYELHEEHSSERTHDAQSEININKEAKSETSEKTQSNFNAQLQSNYEKEEESNLNVQSSSEKEQQSNYSAQRNSEKEQESAYNAQRTSEKEKQSSLNVEKNSEKEKQSTFNAQSTSEKEEESAFSAQKSSEKEEETSFNAQKSSEKEEQNTFDAQKSSEREQQSSFNAESQHEHISDTESSIKAESEASYDAKAESHKSKSQSSKSLEEDDSEEDTETETEEVCTCRPVTKTTSKSKKSKKSSSESSSQESESSDISSSSSEKESASSSFSARESEKDSESSSFSASASSKDSESSNYSASSSKKESESSNLSASSKSKQSESSNFSAKSSSKESDSSSFSASASEKDTESSSYSASESEKDSESSSFSAKSSSKQSESDSYSASSSDKESSSSSYSASKHESDSSDFSASLEESSSTEREESSSASSSLKQSESSSSSSKDSLSSSLSSKESSSSSKETDITRIEQSAAGSQPTPPGSVRPQTPAPVGPPDDDRQVGGKVAANYERKEIYHALQASMNLKILILPTGPPGKNCFCTCDNDSVPQIIPVSNLPSLD